MCKELCEFGTTYCCNCGKAICWDTKSVDDFSAPAAATSSGDLYCLSCAISLDRNETCDDDVDVMDDDELPPAIDEDEDDDGFMDRTDNFIGA